MGSGYWGWRLGDWSWGISPNPNSPIPNPQSPIPINFIKDLKYSKIMLKIIIFLLNNKFIIYL